MESSQVSSSEATKPPPKVLAPPVEGSVSSPVKILLEKQPLTSVQSFVKSLQPTVPATQPSMDPKLQVLAVSTTMLPVSTNAPVSPMTSTVPGASTPLSPPFGSAPSQTSHRSRKEKLIVRSDADNIEVHATALAPEAEGGTSMPVESEPELLPSPQGSSSASPTKTKKTDSPVKTTRPYNRRKHASESDPKKKDSLTKKVLVSNAQRRVGMGTEQPKKSTKRRNTIAGGSESNESVTVTSVETSSGAPVSPTKKTAEPVKAPSPKKSARGTLTPQEQALLPILLKGHVSTTSSSSSISSTTNISSANTARAAASPVSQTTNGNDKRMDLRLLGLGLSSVLPIFKPNQKPWQLLKQLLENTEDPEARRRQAAAQLAQSAEPVVEVKEEPKVAIPKGPSRPLQNLDFLEDSESDEDEDSDESSSSTDTAHEESMDEMGEVEAVAVPVKVRDGKVSFTPEAVSLLKRYLSSSSSASSAANTSATHTISAKDQAKSRVRSESESSLPGFNPSVFHPSLLPRPASTPAATYSGAETPPPNLRDSDQNLSRSTEFQFKPLDGPISPGGVNSRWSWGRTGRESPFGGVNFSRFHAASPSGSSTNGSGRRYSRRRHSRMYPPFETSHCMYTKHFCPAPLEPGSTYCIKHVSEKYSPFYVRCAFVSTKTGRRCQNMQYSRDGKNKFCNMHASRLALLRQKLYRKPRPSKDVKDHLNEMRHIQQKLKKPKRTEAAAYLEEYCDYKLQTQCMENEIEVVDPIEELNLKVEDMCKYQVEHDSDGGCELEDEYECLKNAGYYTTEEVIRILKSKLSKLRELYVKEFDFLKLYYLLKRKEYLNAEDKLRSSGLKVSRNPKTLFKWKHLVTPEFIKKEMKTYEKTKVLLNYHRLRGQTAVLHHLAKKHYEEVKEKIAKERYGEETDSDEENPIIKDILVSSRTTEKPPKPAVCSYDDGIITCDKVPLPASNFCHQHILKDERQVMFQACNYPTDENEFCQNPLLKKIRRSGCDYHRLFRLKRFMKSHSERKARSELLKSLPRATFQDHVKMLEDLVSSKIGSVEEFDKEVEYILSKGLDCSDSSASDNENDYDFQVNDEDEEEDEPAPAPEAGGDRRKRQHGNRGRRRTFGPYNTKRRMRMEAEAQMLAGVNSPATPQISTTDGENSMSSVFPSTSTEAATSVKPEFPINGQPMLNGSTNGIEAVNPINSTEDMKVSNGCLSTEPMNGNGPDDSTKSTTTGT